MASAAVITPTDFEPARFAQGGKFALGLQVVSGEHRIVIPALLVRGAQTGKTLVAAAGVHGDEFEGVRALLETYREINPREMSGDLVAVPVANPPAFWNGTRTSLLDGENLARIFPGRTDGSPTEAIAHCLANSVIARADFFLDLHSGGVRLRMPSMVGYDSNDPRSRAAALAFGASVVWAHSRISPGRTISFAADRHIPWLYTEARGAGSIDPNDLWLFKRGVINLMRHLKILEGAPETVPVKHHLSGDGDIDRSLVAQQSGFLVPGVGLLEKVTAGQEMGRLLGLDGATIDVFRAPREGLVVLVREFPVVAPGDPLFLVTGVLD